MLWLRPVAWLLLIALLAALLPFGQAAARCPFCGKRGACCCQTRAAAPAGSHCAGGACMLRRSVVPTAVRAAAPALPQADGALSGAFAFPVPAFAGLAAAPGRAPLSPLLSPPPTPPPQPVLTV